jgi:5-hydroxyisourate hydrolase-like protein (transthyretin family)
MIIFKSQYGSFTTEADGRLSGHVMTITGKRSDGKYMVTHAFGSGKRIRKVYTPDQLFFEAVKFDPKLADSLI